MRCLWYHSLTSYSCFQTNVLAKFVDIICIFFYTQSPYFMCHCTNCKLSALQVRISEENKLNATTQQLTTAKISGCILKQVSKTSSTGSEQFTTAKWGCANVLLNTSSGVWKVCSWTGWRTPRFARSNLAKLHKNCKCALRKNTFNFLLCIEVQKTSSFPFSLLWHYKMPECFYVNNCCFWARATVLPCGRNW